MPRPPEVRDRLASVDVLRGFTMLWLIGGAEVLLGLVDVTGPPDLARAVSVQLSHVAWEGVHAYDLIFPMFVFTAGVSVPLAVEAQRARGATSGRIAIDAAVRAAMLFALGLVHNGALGLPAVAELRIMGVLQRVALAALATTLAYLWRDRPRDLAVLAAALLVGYAVALSAGPSYAPGSNVSDLVDLRAFAPGQLFTPTGDPEGLVSTLGAIATALLGATAGAILQRRPRDRTTVVGLAAAGLALLGIGTSWGTRLPVIKQLWTSSFVLVAGGWSLLLFAVALWLVDVRPRPPSRRPHPARIGVAAQPLDGRRATPVPGGAGRRPVVRFLGVIGRGCIVAYIGQDLVDLGATADQLTGGLQRRAPAFAFLLAATTSLALRWLVLDLLDRHGIHLHLGLPRPHARRTPKAPPGALRQAGPSDALVGSDPALELREVDAAQVPQEVAHLPADHDDRVATVALPELEVAAVDAEPVDRVDVGDRPA